MISDEPELAESALAEAAPLVTAAEGQLSLRSRQGRTMLGTITSAHFAHHVSNSLLNPLLPLIRDGFGLSYAQTGFAVSAYGLSNGFSNAPFGVLADRIGPRNVIVAGLLVTGIVSAALSFSTDYGQLLLFLVALGVTSGTYHAPAAAIIARVFSMRVRGAAMGFHITGGHLAFFAAPFVAGIVATATGTWRTPYLWFAIVPVLTAVVLWLIAPRDHPAPRAGGVFASFREVGSVIQTIGPLITLSVAFHVCLATVFAFLALYLVDARGVSPILAASAFGITQLTGIFGSPLGGFLSDRFGRRTPILISLGAVGPFVYLLTIIPTELILIPLVLIGLAFSMRSTATEVLVMDTAPADRRGTVLGAYYLAAQPIGGVIAPLFGLLAGAIGISAAYGLIGMLLVGMSVFAVAFGRRL